MMNNRAFVAVGLSIMACCAVLVLVPNEEVVLVSGVPQEYERSCYTRECSITERGEICATHQHSCAPLRVSLAMAPLVRTAERHVFDQAASFHLFAHEMLGENEYNRALPELAAVRKLKVKKSGKTKSNGLKVVAGPAAGMDKKKLKSIRKKLAPLIAAKKAYYASVAKAKKKYVEPYQATVKKAQKPFLAAQKKFMGAMMKAKKKFMLPFSKIVMKEKKKYYASVAKLRKKMGIKAPQPQQVSGKCVERICSVNKGKMQCKAVKCGGLPFAGAKKAPIRVVHIVPTMKISPKMMKAAKKRMAKFLKKMKHFKGSKRKMAVVKRLRKLFGGMLKKKKSAKKAAPKK